MSVAIPEQPGSFLRLYALLHPRNVTEFSYRRNGSEQANVIVSLHALAGKMLEEDRADVVSFLQKEGFKVTDFSSNELAKAHVRHLAGGRVISSAEAGTTKRSTITSESEWPSADSPFVELVYRFEFPEAPGALNRFLTTIKSFNQVWFDAMS